MITATAVYGSVVVAGLMLCQPAEAQSGAASNPAPEEIVHIGLDPSQPVGASSVDVTNRVIGHLKMRNRVITIFSGPVGALYTVKALDGSVLAVELTPDALAAKFPELKPVVEEGVAEWAVLAPDRPQMDAIESLQRSERRETITIQKGR